jgi:hypothetical protein
MIACAVIGRVVDDSVSMHCYTFRQLYVSWPGMANNRETDDTVYILGVVYRACALAAHLGVATAHLLELFVLGDVAGDIADRSGGGR